MAAVIESTPAVLAKAIRPEEEEAVMIVWKQRGGAADETVPEADALEILDEIRQREAKIEARVLGALRRATSESRRSPRRHMVFALGIVLPLIILLLALIAGVIALIGSLSHR